ncbi:MAG: hypothetical protein LBR00_06005, partial [Clostridiales Family XIII bacterium]|nr:hypothetical protein [Clostridiales Family XIII bacterium]
MTERRYRVDKVLLTQAQIEARAAEIGAQISRDYAARGAGGVVFVGILTGSVMWMAQLLKSV